MDQKTYRYYDLIMAAFVTILLCSNLIGATKVCEIGGLTFGGTVVLFPISYLFGDILTEVYGYRRSRKVVWAGFFAMIFASLFSTLVIQLPPAQGWTHQSDLETVFGQTPRLVGASLLAYFVGEFSNSYVMAKMKILTQGKWLWSRILGSTVIGEAIDSILFYPLAFYGFWPDQLLIEVMFHHYVLKVTWEMLMTPLTYRIVAFLKAAENEDYYDLNTNFSPISFR